MCPVSTLPLPPFNILSILSAIFLKSFSFLPRVVSAAVPRRMPEGSAGGLRSKGMAFLFTMMPSFSNRSLASLPDTPPAPCSSTTSLIHVSMRMRWVSVPPLIMRQPRTLSSPARMPAFLTTWAAYRLNEGAAASRKATATAAMAFICGPPCRPGNTALSIFLSRSRMSFLAKMSAARGPRKVLWVVVVTISAYGKGDG